MVFYTSAAPEIFYLLTPLNILILYNGAGFIKRYVRSVELHKF